MIIVYVFSVICSTSAMKRKCRNYMYVHVRSKGHYELSSLNVYSGIVRNNQ
jgi:hypothetical protein